MLSDLANSVKGVDPREQDDAFLVAHLLAGHTEIAELAELCARLQQRQNEAEAIKAAIEKTLLQRHIDGKNFAMGRAIIRVGAGGDAVSEVTISQAEILEIPQAAAPIAQPPGALIRPKKIPDPVAPRRVK